MYQRPRKAYTLVGVNGNAFAIMAYVVRAMKEVGFPVEKINVYKSIATIKDYNWLLCKSIEMIEEVNDELEKQGLLIPDDDDYYEEDY